MTKQNENGRTLLEMLGVLAIIGVITVGAMSGLKFGTDSFRATALHDMVETTAQGVSDLYSWSRQYPTDDNSDTVIPLAEVVPDNGVCDAFECYADGDVVKAVTTYGTMIIANGTRDYFMITLTDIPKDICMRLAAITWQNVIWPEDQTCDDDTQDIEFESN